MASKFGRGLWGALAFAGVMASATAARAELVGICKFDPNSAQVQGFTFNGDATASSAVLHLTRYDSGSTQAQNGSAYLTTPVNMTATSDFSTHFQFKMEPNSGTTGGDGITFTMQNKGPTALGGSGSSLAINGVNPSVSVEFDTKKDVQTDADSNHIAVIVDGKTNQHIQQTPVPFVMKNGSLTDAWIDYTASNHTLKVYMGQGVPKPATALLTTTLDVYTTVDALGAGNKVYIGFAGSTDNMSTNNQDISYWVFANDGTPLTDCVPCANDTNCNVVPTTPACNVFTGFCVQCTDTNHSACTGNTPVCDTDANRCVECNTSTDCARFPSKPICDQHVCKPCGPANDPAADYPNASPPACFDPKFPACQNPAAGTLQTGSCTECSDRQHSVCDANPQKPTCLSTLGVCGCTADTQCGLANGGLICQAGVCQPGCRPDGSVTCPTGSCQDQGGGTGQCVTGCTDDTGCAQPTSQCLCAGAQCFCTQCDPADGTQSNPNCPTDQLCSPAGTCVQCTPGNTNNCDVNGTGGACKTNGQCGCVTDADCGGIDSGRVCDDTNKVCRAGCRGISGNRCPEGLKCTSTTAAIGQCVTNPGDAGADAGDAGGNDGGGNDGGTPDGGPKPDGSVGPTGDGGGGDGGNLLDDVSIEGGGCNCTMMPGGGALPVGALGVAALGVLAMIRRRRTRR